jgi:hypothetical protein
LVRIHFQQKNRRAPDIRQADDAAGFQAKMTLRRQREKKTTGQANYLIFPCPSLSRPVPSQPSRSPPPPRHQRCSPASTRLPSLLFLSAFTRIRPPVRLNGSFKGLPHKANS